MLPIAVYWMPNSYYYDFLKKEHKLEAEVEKKKRKEIWFAFAHKIRDWTCSKLQINELNSLCAHKQTNKKKPTDFECKGGSGGGQ